MFNRRHRPDQGRRRPQRHAGDRRLTTAATEARRTNDNSPAIRGWVAWARRIREVPAWFNSVHFVVTATDGVDGTDKGLPQAAYPAASARAPLLHGRDAHATRARPSRSGCHQELNQAKKCVWEPDPLYYSVVKPFGVPRLRGSNWSIPPEGGTPSTGVGRGQVLCETGAG